MNTKKLNLNILTSPLPYLAVFLSSLFHPFDNDLGWHLAYGKYFLTNGKILKENIFSTEMLDFRWVNSSWLTDLISYMTFDNFGFLGLSVLGALIVTATFYFFAKAAKLDYFEKALIFPVLVYLLSLVNSVSFRGQILSLMFLGILFYILGLHQKNKAQIIYTLPLLFGLWSNVHGQFILGLAIFTLWVSTDFISAILVGDKNIVFILKEKIGLIITFIASVFAVLVNPFGIGVYQEAIKHFNNPLSKYIVEWVGTETLSTLWWHQIILGVAIFFGLLFLIFSDKFKENIPQISTSAILYLLSFNIRRFAWPMYYFSMSLLKPLASYFRPESKKYQQISATFIFLFYLVVLFLIDNPIKRITNMSWQTYCTKYVQCSDGPIEYLTSNQLTANLLTYYGWGGYMIWNHPDVKPSIDGRMHLWRGEAGYSAFDDYFSYEQNQKEINDSKYDVVLMYNQKPVYRHLEKLTQEGKWQKVYEDKYSGVFTRNR